MRLSVDSIFFVVILAVWLVAAYAMIKMLSLGLRAGERFPAMLFNFRFLLASYNRRNFWTFGACVLTMVAIAAIYNALFFAGYITP